MDLLCEELGSLATGVNHVLRGISAHQNVELKQLILIDAGEDGASAEELCYNASQAPHVDLVVIGKSKHDLRSPIEARLHIGKSVHAEG